ncbi:uncharacterized protein [Rutidosis leptorrhynchoides]|uniref:uncharacterized protein isoform X2 n=1 Tax=Rutidosis leptorrhynchoides TaxID=125765 RepID=UPI003A992386
MDWYLSKLKSWFNWLLIMIMIHIQLARIIHGSCIAEERKALLDIKASLFDSFVFDHVDPLPTWVDDGGECCDWERVECNKTTGHVINLLLEEVVDYEDGGIWPLNVSIFLNFKELRSLILSLDHLDNGIVSTGLEKLSSLKNIEILDLGGNSITNGIFPSLGALTSLKTLDLGYNELEGKFPAYGFEERSMLKKLKVLNLGFNRFNESLITSLKALPSLQVLDLSHNPFSSESFPAQDLANLTNLEKLDLSSTGIKSIQGTMNTLVHLNLDGNYFKKDDVMQAMAAFPSLRFLSLRHNNINGTLPTEAFASLRHLEVLDMSDNYLGGSIPSSISALISLKVFSFAYNELNGSLPDQAFCRLKNLEELDLSQNKFSGNLSECFSSLTSLKLFDISSNQFTGTLPPSLFANLTSLEYVDFSFNKFEGSLSFSSLSNHTKLQLVAFISNNDIFEVETEEPIGWDPMFQLKVLVLSNCNINRLKGRVVPSFLLHQHKLQLLNLSHNSLEMQFPNWLINSNPDLEVVSLRNNSVAGTIRMPLYRNDNIKWLDMSDNQITGTLPLDLENIFPYIDYLNLARNSLNGPLPWSMANLSGLQTLDLSNNNFSGEVPETLLFNCQWLSVLKLSNNNLYGEVLPRKINISKRLEFLLLDNNQFTGVLTKEFSTEGVSLKILGISGNLFSGVIPGWITNITTLYALAIRDNMFEGQFPCGTASFLYLDISQNNFSGSIPSCLGAYSGMKHLLMESNIFTGSIPESFHNLTNLLTLDMGNNKLSSNVPEFLGELSSLRILILRINNLVGSIPKQLCHLSYLRLLDLSRNFLSGSIPNCLQNITQSGQLVFLQFQRFDSWMWYYPYSFIGGIGHGWSFEMDRLNGIFDKLDEVQFLTKSRPDTYKAGILDYMSGLDLSCNNLTGEIPKELGMLVHIHSVNLSHNQLTGPIPSSFSNLADIESLDISSNHLSGKVPSELIVLYSLSTFIVANNNLSGSLPQVNQFATFTADSYKGNPFLCGPPLAKSCAPTKTNSTMMAPEETEEKWYDVDMVFFRASLFSTWFLFVMGFFGVLYINPNWRRRWFVLVEECLYTCYNFLSDCSHKRRF